MNSRRILVILLTILFLLAFVTPVHANNTIRIFYAGPEDTGVYIALTLAPKGTFSFVDRSGSGRCSCSEWSHSGTCHPCHAHPGRRRHGIDPGAGPVSCGC